MGLLTLEDKNELAEVNKELRSMHGQLATQEGNDRILYLMGRQRALENKRLKDEIMQNRYDFAEGLKKMLNETVKEFLDKVGALEVKYTEAITKASSDAASLSVKAAELDRKESDLSKREADVSARETTVSSQDDFQKIKADFSEKVRVFNAEKLAFDNSIGDKELNIKSREAIVSQREQAVSLKEQQVAEKEASYKQEVEKNIFNQVMAEGLKNLNAQS